MFRLAFERTVFTGKSILILSSVNTVLLMDAFYPPGSMKKRNQFVRLFALFVFSNRDDDCSVGKMNRTAFEKMRFFFFKHKLSPSFIFSLSCQAFASSVSILSETALLGFFSGYFSFLFRTPKLHSPSFQKLWIQLWTIATIVSN